MKDAQLNKEIFTDEERQEHVFFTPQEEEYLSGKLGVIGEIVNITEQDFLSL